MDIQEIEVIIEKNGEVTIKVHGVKGKSCLDLTHDLEKALGDNIIMRIMTSEAMDINNSTRENNNFLSS